jgi:hypothetical protein
VNLQLFLAGGIEFCSRLRSTVATVSKPFASVRCAATIRHINVRSLTTHTEKTPHSKASFATVTYVRPGLTFLVWVEDVVFCLHGHMTRLSAVC